MWSEFKLQLRVQIFLSIELETAITTVPVTLDSQLKYSIASTRIVLF